MRARTPGYRVAAGRAAPATCAASERDGLNANGPSPISACTTHSTNRYAGYSHPPRGGPGTAFSSLKLVCSKTNSYYQFMANKIAPTHRRLGWDELQIILAVAQRGTLSGAARALGVTHSTVFRRINEVEARMGVRLF